eukprot:jgi/Chrzof1/11490/UNPLg00422.t1
MKLLRHAAPWDRDTIRDNLYVGEDTWVYAQPPPPQLNGGLYTGQPFKADAPYRNYPVSPDVGTMIHDNLRSAEPPAEALMHYPSGGHRPGNYPSALPGVSTYRTDKAAYGIRCVQY